MPSSMTSLIIAAITEMLTPNLFIATHFCVIIRRAVPSSSFATGSLCKDNNPTCGFSVTTVGGLFKFTLHVESSKTD